MRRRGWREREIKASLFRNRDARVGVRKQGKRERVQAGGLGETGREGRRETGDGRRETGDGRRETGDGRRETGDGRRETGDG